MGHHFEGDSSFVKADKKLENIDLTEMDGIGMSEQRIHSKVHEKNCSRYGTSSGCVLRVHIMSPGSNWHSWVHCWGTMIISYTWALVTVPGTRLPASSLRMQIPAHETRDIPLE